MHSLISFATFYTLENSDGLRLLSSDAVKFQEDGVKTLL